MLWILKPDWKILTDIKITTKFQKNHYSELPEIELNERSTTMELKGEKKHMGSGGRGRTQSSLGPHPHEADKGQEGYFSFRAALEEQGVPAPHEGPQPRVPVPVREVPLTYGCKNQWE